MSLTNPHDLLIQDAALDYYGKRLATCLSDTNIKVFDVDGDQHKLVDTLKAHLGAVWTVSWGHPKFGVILASGSYDGKVIIWREENGHWRALLQHLKHTASVNRVEWAPHEYGAVLLCGLSDGQISIFEIEENGDHQVYMFPAHDAGVNLVLWAPVGAGKRFVTGGCDNLVKVWSYDSTKHEVTLEATLEGHTDWTRDVAWSSSVLFKSYIASASLDKTVLIWTQEGNKGPWKKQLLNLFPDVAWRVSWSLSGNVLAVSCADNKVSLWKETLGGDWESGGGVQ